MLSAKAETCSSLEELEVLLGEWQEKSEFSLTREEWRKVSMLSYEGVGATFDLNGVEQNRETLRLVEMSGEIFYIAKVAQNETPIAFKLTQCGEGFFVFENSSHDFPNKITYFFKDANKVKVAVSGGLESGFEINLVRKK